jgi:hypothetical protein
MEATKCITLRPRGQCSQNVLYTTVKGTQNSWGNGREEKHPSSNQESKANTRQEVHHSTKVKRVLRVSYSTIWIQWSPKTLKYFQFQTDLRLMLVLLSKKILHSVLKKKRNFLVTRPAKRGVRGIRSVKCMYLWFKYSSDCDKYT